MTAKLRLMVMPCLAAIVSTVMFGTLSARQAVPRQNPNNPNNGTTQGITLFAEPNFRGFNANFRTDVPDLRQFNMNDRVDSLQIAPGEVWEVCEDINYGGRCQAFSYDEASLGRVNWGGVVSSFRQIRDNSRGRGRGLARGNVQSLPVRPRAVLFDEAGYRGNSYVVRQSMPTVPELGTRAGSVKVYGGAWQLCDAARFTGRCVTVSDGIVNLAGVGLRNGVHSARPLTGAGAGSAQSQGITLFAEPNFRGLASSFHADVPDLRVYNMNDRVDSLQIGRGELWEVCEDINYGGRCQVFTASEPNLPRVSWGGTISSFRLVQDDGRGRYGRGPVPPYPPVNPRLVLFDDVGFRGQTFIVSESTPALPALSNRAGSAKTYGGSWQICDGERFTGRCVTVGNSEVDLGRLGLRDRVSSARPLGIRGR